MRSFLLFLALFIPGLLNARDFRLLSPDRNVLVVVSVDTSIGFSISYAGKTILSRSEVSMNVNGTELGKNPKIEKNTTDKFDLVIHPEIPVRNSRIPDQYHQLILDFSEHFSLVFRAYNDAVSYRFRTRFNDRIKINSESAVFNFPGNPIMLATLAVGRDSMDGFHSSFEESYSQIPIGELQEKDLIFLPALLNAMGSPKMIITESDLMDYPGMWLSKNPDQNSSLIARFAKFPEEERVSGGEYKQMVVSRRADYLAMTEGNREFPWRIIGLAREDKDLLNNDIVYQLARPSVLKDISWIKPGKSTDEWIVSRNFYGVDFETGFNNETYRFLIDFAAAFGLEYMMFDAGWSDQNDLLKITPGLDVPGLIRYAKEKNVGILLWTLAMTTNRQMVEAFNQFEKWGVKGIMVDFMDRDDQKTVQFYENVLKAAAEKHLMVNFHGAFKETGLNRTYPNLITREGVLGHEFNMWSDRVTPQHNLLIAFIRNFAGPMDYEGGCMNNGGKNDFRVIFERPMSQGTRVHQLAQYVAYTSPLQYMAGNFSDYLREPEFTAIMAGVPTTWDETRPLEAVLGEYLLLARRKQGVWYVAALNNWNSRDILLDLSFLKEGNYKATIVMDGVNADKYAEDYQIDYLPVSNEKQLNIHLAPGGGWFGMFLPEN